ncbi:MAG TPA: alpha/beta family hydrolase, partial [Mycobacteriales bacterium]
LGRLPLVVAGRSSGARVACRTVVEVGAAAVLALAFPLHPPGRPERDRGAELDAVTVPVLVVQGDRDPFGMPVTAPGRAVRVIPGANHSLRSATGQIAEAVVDWLSGLGFARRPT